VLVCWFLVITIILLAQLLLQAEISIFLKGIFRQRTSCWARSTEIKNVAIIGQNYLNVLSRQVELFVDAMMKVPYIQALQILVQLTFKIARVTL
jgi:hypothetical protein